MGGLLVIEGGLLLLEQFDGVAKGWPVLLALATAIAVVLLLLLWFLASRLLGWQFQFSLRTLLLASVAIAVLSAWLRVEIMQAQKQRQVVTDLHRYCYLGAGYEFQVFHHRPNGDIYIDGPPAPAWLRRVLGDDFFVDVSGLGNTAIQTPVTDWMRLQKLSQFRRLRTLGLSVSSITDGDLVYLKGLSQLQDLLLGGTAITDAGLAHLEPLQQLHRLELAQTHITDAGLNRLKSLSQLETLSLADTLVSDAGLENLKELRQLKTLDLGRTRVTRQGVEDLQQALPACAIHGAPPTEEVGPSPSPTAPPGG